MIGLLGMTDERPLRGRSWMTDGRPLGGRRWITDGEWTLERADYLQAGLHLTLIDNSVEPPVGYSLLLGIATSLDDLGNAISAHAPRAVADALVKKVPADWVDPVE